MNRNNPALRGDMDLQTLEQFFRSAARHFALADETAATRALAPFFADGPEEPPPDRPPRRSSPGRPATIDGRAPRPAAGCQRAYSRHPHAGDRVRALWGGGHG